MNAISNDNFTFRIEKIKCNSTNFMGTLSAEPTEIIFLSQFRHHLLPFREKWIIPTDKYYSMRVFRRNNITFRGINSLTDTEMIDSLFFPSFGMASVSSKH